jgi:uncharacterized protein YjbI with pentapeptide repeats
VETALLKGTDFTDATLESATFMNVHLMDATFTNTYLKNAFFVESDLTNVSFTEADLTGATFRNTVLSGIDFSNADLSGATFVDVNLMNVTFTGANLTGVTFRNDLPNWDEPRIERVDLSLERVEPSELESELSPFIPVEQVPYVDTPQGTFIARNGHLFTETQLVTENAREVIVFGKVILKTFASLIKIVEKAYEVDIDCNVYEDGCDVGKYCAVTNIITAFEYDVSEYDDQYESATEYDDQYESATEYGDW